jgi:spore germination protein KB
MLFELLSKIFHLHNLKPVLGEGYGPLLKTLFPTVLTVPFGELIAFTMILPFLSETHHVKKAGLAAVVISGIQLTLTSAIHIAALGAHIVTRSTFPMMTSISLINIANFITRLDAFVVAFAVIFGFFKLTIFLYCAVLGLGDLFKMKTPNKLAIPMGLVMLGLSLFMAPNFTRHIEIGLKFVPYYLHIPFQFVIPLLLLVIAMIKKHLKFSKA